jgi:1-acyl-sn-glycerol-3-phosphate acyltransferase
MHPSPPAHAARHDLEAQLHSIVATLARQMAGRPEDLAHEGLLDAVLDRDLGIDSLARVELGLRIERALGTAVTEDALVAAVTARDLLHALAAPGRARQRFDGDAAATRTPAPPASAPADPTPAFTRMLQWARGGVALVIVGVTGFAISLLPGLARRRAATRHLARIALRVLGVRLVIRGREHVVRGQPVVLVANHGSYLDAVAITAALDIDFAFVAKAEFADRWLPRHLLGRAGTHFVERFDPRRSVAHARLLAREVAEGGSLLLFPEGTFVPRPGLLPFRLGAFVVAIEAGAPVVAIAISGARAALPFPSWRPRPGVVTLTIAPPIDSPSPGSPDAFTRALDLRDAARTAILRHCGEPDMRRHDAT